MARRSTRFRRGLLLAVLAGGWLLAHPPPSPAQTERGETPACRQDADRLDDLLSDAFGDETALRIALVEVRGALNSHRGIVADCTASLSMNEVLVLVDLDDMPEAERAAAAYAQRFESRVSDEEWAEFLANRGYVLARLGRTQAATEHYAEAAAMADRVSPYLGASVLLQAALTFNDVQDAPRARAYLRLADSLARANLDSAYVRETLGEIELEQALGIQREIERGALPDSLQGLAEETARRALTILDETTYQAPDRAMAQLVIARARLRLGDLSGARAELARARPMVERGMGFTTYIAVEESMTEAEVAEAEGDLPAARVAYTRAVDAARDELLTSRALDALLALGAVEERAGDDRAAAVRYREAIDLSEAIRQRQGLQDWSLSASEQTARPYARFAALLARQGDADGAFQMLDASRARRLFDLRASLNARSRLDLDDRLRVDSLLDALDGVRLALPTARDADRASLDAEATRLQRTLARTSGLELEPPPPLDLGALADTLASREQVLVSYLLEDDATWAFLVGPEGVGARPLHATRADLHDAIQSISGMWRDQETEIDEEFEITALERLYQMLLAPIREAIPDGAGIVTVPPSDLATVPFGMLVEPGGPTDAYATARYLIRRHPVSTELAAALLVTPSDGASGTEHLVFGRSEFEKEEKADLPFVRDEARRVRRSVPAPLLRLDDDATEAALTTRLGTASLVHLASHATADPEFPLYSQILLADDPEADDDGTLHLYELESQPLSADLVVLSGCSTARGRTLRGEGMIGLQYGVRAAGARSALATLWPVDDRATVEIMGGFYDALADGLPKDRALQASQIAYLNRAEEPLASPFYWAPAVLSGDASPVPWDRPSRLGFWAFLLGGLAAAGTVAWRLTQRRRRV